MPESTVMNYACLRAIGSVHQRISVLDEKSIVYVPQMITYKPWKDTDLYLSVIDPSQY